MTVIKKEILKVQRAEEDMKVLKENQEAKNSHLKARIEELELNETEQSRNIDRLNNLYTILENKHKRTVSDLTDREEDLADLREQFAELSQKYAEAAQSNEELTKARAKLEKKLGDRKKGLQNATTIYEEQVKEFEDYKDEKETKIAEQIKQINVL